jgi:hypothetical protein
MAATLDYIDKFKGPVSDASVAAGSNGDQHTTAFWWTRGDGCTWKNDNPFISALIELT